MILCVTLNPCLDKTLTVPPWHPGDVSRATSAREVVGGKGNNVARALKGLGRSPRPVTFLGGPVGEWCATLLRREDGLEPIVTTVGAPTRTILTVRTEGRPDQTAFFDPDGTVTPAEAEDLLRKVETALASGEVRALTLSGSSPSPSTHGLYSDLIALALGRRVPIFLDTYGPALGAIWGFWPQVIHINRREAADHLGRERIDDDEVFRLLDRWSERGVGAGVISDGPNAVLARVGGRHWRAIPPRIEAVNPVGCGDCLIAGLVDGWLSDLEPEPLLRRGVAASVANALVWDAGAITREEVARIEPEVVIEPAEGNGLPPSKAPRLGRIVRR